jgi:hypothetical protein
MNYAQNLHDAELITSVREWTLTPASGADMAKWLLFDGAVLGEKTTKRVLRMIPQNAVQNIFIGTPLARYGLLSPHLVHLNDESVKRNFLTVVLETMNGFPAVSLIDAKSDAHTLRRCLSWLGQARTGDGLDIYCRFADTRVTPSLMRTLVENQLGTLRHCIREWRIINRLGRLDTVLSNRVEAPAERGEPRDSEATEQLRLSDEQFSMMMNEAEADEIFQMLCEGASDLAARDKRGNFYLRLSSLVAAARERGLAQCKDIYQFSVIGLATSDEFYQVPELDECWEKMRAGIDDFSAVVASWSDETWNALANICAANKSKFLPRGEHHEPV